MGLINFYQSLKKSSKLRKISHALSKGDAKEEMYLNELMLLIYSEEHLKHFLVESGVTKDTLKEIYYKLLLNGAGQFADGHYVAASSLVYGQTLLFIIDHYLDNTFYIKDMDDYNSSLFISNRLITYFKNKETGEVVYL